jgi:hypothetical protein
VRALRYLLNDVDLALVFAREIQVNVELEVGQFVEFCLALLGSSGAVTAGGTDAQQIVAGFALVPAALTTLGCAGDGEPEPTMTGTGAGTCSVTPSVRTWLGRARPPSPSRS